MPKISTNIIKVFTNEMNKEFKIDVNYNQNHLFYAEVPELLNIAWDHLDQNQKEAFQTKVYYKSKMDAAKNPQSFKRIVTAIHEGTCLELMHKLIKKLLSSAIVKRDVIIVYYNPKDLCQYGNLKHNKEHPQIGIQFGLTYAQETSVGDGKKVYNFFTKRYGIRDEEVVDRKEMTLSGYNCTVIDDTPENRLFMEGIYDKLNGLKEALKQYTETPEALVQLIQSNQLLLG